MMVSLTLAAAITVDPAASALALTSLTCVFVLGLATLARPSPATITWGVAYSLGLLGAYIWTGAAQTGADWMRAISSALLVSFTPLVWLGLRMFFGRRLYWWPVIGFVILAPIVLGTLISTPSYPLAFRIVYIISGAFAGLIAVELFRVKRGSRDIALPLALAASMFAIASVITLASAMTDTSTAAGADYLDLLRAINGIGTQVISVCAAFTLVLLVRADAGTAGAGEDIAQRSRWRLRKAKERRDRIWSMLDVRLDHPEDLRQAWTGANYAKIIEIFHRRVLDALPPTADAMRFSDERIVILIRETRDGIRRMLRTLLNRISSTDDDDLGVRFSLSVGWVEVADFDYDYEVLIEQAARGAQQAMEKGGDCWEYVGGPAATP